MHIKASIADDTVLTGRYDCSKSATSHNHEDSFVIEGGYALQAHLAKFNQLWGERLPAVSPEIKKRQERAAPEFTAYITRMGKKKPQVRLMLFAQELHPDFFDRSDTARLYTV